MNDSLPFGSDTVSWRVDLEPVVVLGGGRALLLQVAHPLVAAGVQQHSDYEKDPYGRLFGTLDVMTKMLFGSPEVSQRQRGILTATHRAVAGHDECGVSYRAGDPDLLTWVWATLVDTALLMYEAVFGPLDRADRDRFYAEQHHVAAGCGIPEGHVPSTFVDFGAYVEDMVRHRLRVTQAARAVAKNVLAPPLPALLQPARHPAGWITAGFLPSGLREAYGLTWGRGQERALRATLATLRHVVPLIPRSLRERPLRAMAGPRRVEPPGFLRDAR